MSDNSDNSSPAPRLRIRIIFSDETRLGPGKADLLERIRDTGSIAAAGRTMSMSYKRAWSLVEEMNSAYRTPLVTSTRGGTKGGGARLTEAGEEILEHYRALEDITVDKGAVQIEQIRAMLKDGPGKK